MFSLLIALSVLVVFSFIPEFFLKPRVSSGYRPQLISLSTSLHLLFLGLIFFGVLLIFQRPFFAMIVALVTLSILVIVSNAKYQTLREPLVFSDIAMFSQAFKHPRLYLPFLGILPAIGIPVLGGLAIIGMINYEPAIQFSRMAWLIMIIAIVVIIFAIQAIALKLKLTQDPIKDINQHGLLATLLAYSIQARTRQHKQQIESVLLSSPMQKKPIDEENTSPKPNVIVIQSESFFDVRHLHPSIKSDVLKNFDQFCKESFAYGQLNVPAWGANTMRTEFSVLTGIASEKLGFYRFYPYQYLFRQNIPSIASHLKQQGYHCICVHPHPASFFGRDRIFPKMGFDEFIDIESFDKSKTFGPYLSDKAVTEKIIETLSLRKELDKPLFVFAITMENHGPLHLEKTNENDVANYYCDRPPTGHNDLTVYLRHLKNADQMLADLRMELDSGSGVESVLCFYGDHLPSMPKIYETTAYHGENSDYFIWESGSNKQANDKTQGQQTEMKAENLLVNLSGLLNLS
jgi:phosphoglycerol transferase MdoB-like AlkP superfamily enzyme